MFAVGLVIKLATYTAALSSLRADYVYSPRYGLYYYVTYGLMLPGGGEFIYGLAGWWDELK